MAEQFALEQRFGNGGAVDGYHRLARSRAQVVQRVSQALLARSTFAEQQHGGVCRSEPFDHPAHPQHRLTGSHDTVQRSLGPQTLALDIFLQLIYARRTLDHRGQHVRVDRLLAEVVRSHLDRSQGVFAALPPRHHDDLGPRRDAMDRGDRRETLLDTIGIRRQAEILQHNGRLVAA